MPNIIKLREFVKEQHGSQKRKYTNEPYFNHLIDVAEMAHCRCDYGFEIGLCHDLFEDTLCNLPDLYAFLQQIGYYEVQASFICDSVGELTDVYTSEAYPELNRDARKQLEATRLHNISPNSQTVKYCDLINNTSSIVQHDPKFAVTYLAEKRQILSGMDKGNHYLYKKCVEVLTQAEHRLNIFVA